MGLSENPTAKEFGGALRSAREKAGVDLETLCERTKISRRMIEALEEGQLSRLPAGVFPRLFLRQVVEILREDPAPWLKAFDGVYERFSRSTTQSHPLPVAPQRGRRVGPWLLGSALVAGALATVVVVERQQARRPADSVPPTPEAILAALPPTPLPTAEPTPVPPAGPGPEVLVIRTAGRSCWVQVRVAGQDPVARLLAADTAWELAAGGKDVDLVLGDAGAVHVDYLGTHREDLGEDGTVARIRLSSTASPPPAPASP
jgi:cytoskeletal protein RodZ